MTITMFIIINILIVILLNVCTYLHIVNEGNLNAPRV